MNDVQSPDAALAAEIARLKAEFPRTRELYREVCALLFFRHGGDDAGHMRGVLPDRKKASGIGCTGNKSQIAREVPIRGVCSLAAGQPAQIEERHTSMIAG